MDVAVSGHIVARNDIGQFIAACSKAAEETVRQLIEDGERLSKEMAPVGHKEDLRTVPLREGMFSEMLSRTQGRWGCSSRHALPIEFGAGAHVITGNPFLSFYWENAGRNWVPGLFGEPDVVQHPGNAAQPFLRPAYAMVREEALAVMRAKYPS